MEKEKTYVRNGGGYYPTQQTEKRKEGNGLRLIALPFLITSERRLNIRGDLIE